MKQHNSCGIVYTFIDSCFTQVNKVDTLWVSRQSDRDNNINHKVAFEKLSLEPCRIDHPRASFSFYCAK